jgi:hypothetical protein
MPLLDPRLQAAIKKFPELVMAGACLPDLAIISHRFRHTHLWENAQQLMLSAKTEEETLSAPISKNSVMLINDRVIFFMGSP